jgi:hypothetical protein
VVNSVHNLGHNIPRSAINPAFQHNSYLLKRQVFALTGKFRIYDASDNLLLFSEQRMFRLREDIRVYGDEEKNQELLMIKARQIIDFSPITTSSTAPPVRR